MISKHVPITIMPNLSSYSQYHNNYVHHYLCNYSQHHNNYVHHYLGSQLHHCKIVIKRSGVQPGFYLKGLTKLCTFLLTIRQNSSLLPGKIPMCVPQIACTFQYITNHSHQLYCKKHQLVTCSYVVTHLTLDALSKQLFTAA